MPKRLLLFSAQTAPVYNFITRMERSDTRSTNLLRVLTYHRVAVPGKTPHLYPRVTVTPQAFEQQMRFLAGAYQVISMEELLWTINTGKSFSKRPVLITFDDAYRDFAENALPALRRYNLPAALFVPTAFPGDATRAFWWDRLYAAVEHARELGVVQTPKGLKQVSTAAQRGEVFSSLRDYVKSIPHQQAMEWVDNFCRTVGAPVGGNEVLSWDELRAVARQNITLGAHTRTHPMMSQISKAEIRSETAGSLNDIRAEIGAVLPIFAYPSGGYNREVMEILKQEGVELAFTTNRGHNDIRRFDKLQIKRINIGPRTSMPLLRLQLLGRVGFFHR